MGISRREFLKKSGLVAGFAAVGSQVVSLDRVAAEASGKIRQVANLEEDVTIPSSCIMCVNFCGIRVRRINGVIRQIYGNPENPYNRGNMCPKGQAGIFDAYNPYRIKAPMKRTNANKGPGEDPKWKEISWDEAFSEIGSRLNEIKNDDPRKLIWQHGHGKYLPHKYVARAFYSAFGTPNKIHRTSVCETARHVCDELTWGHHAFLPDIDNTNYMIYWGANPYEGGQWSRWLDRKTAEARERGAKVVWVDPRVTPGVAVADEWVPIKPATDAVLFLAMAKELISQGYVDEDFLVNYTNAPCLVGEDEDFLRDNDGNPKVWDKNSGSAKVFESGIEPALSGTYTVDGKEYRTAYQVFSDNIDGVDASYAADVCGIPADTIRRIAKEFGEAAQIGATVIKGGHVLRYRPVNIYTFRGLATHEYGVQNARARWMVLMLVGAVEAVGSVKLHGPDDTDSQEPSKCEYPPQRVDLKESVYFPYSTHGVAQQVALTLSDPDKYGLPYKPEMQLSYATNRVFSANEMQKQIDGYKEIWAAHIDIVLTEQGDMSDIVLPNVSYLEALHWGYTRSTHTYKHAAIRQPIVNVYNLPYQDTDIFQEYALRAGVHDKWVKYVNDHYGSDLDPNVGRRYSAEELLDAMCRGETGKGLGWFKKHGVLPKKRSIEERYIEGIETVFKGPENKRKMKFYLDQMVGTKKKVKEVVRENNINNVDTTDLDVVYSPLPLKEHAFPKSHDAPPEYDMYLVTHKKMYFNQSCNAENPRLRHVAHDSDENAVLINSSTAAEKGIGEGDEVYVESRIGKVKIKATLSESVRPDTVAISYHYGHWSNSMPGYAKKGTSCNWILELNADRVSGMNNFNDTKVKVYKA